MQKQIFGGKIGQTKPKQAQTWQFFLFPFEQYGPPAAPSRFASAKIGGFLLVHYKISQCGNALKNGFLLFIPFLPFLHLRTAFPAAAITAKVLVWFDLPLKTFWLLWIGLHLPFLKLYIGSCSIALSGSTSKTICATRAAPPEPPGFYESQKCFNIILYSVYRPFVCLTNNLFVNCPYVL